MKARAAIWRAGTAELSVETLDVAPPGESEVLVKMAYSGVCHSDYHVLLGEWQQPSPMVLGHEGAAVVVDVGARVKAVVPGDHVILSWTPRCGTCEYCLVGASQLCRTASDVVFKLGSLPDGTYRFNQAGKPVHSYLGLGTFAEYAVVHESQVVAIPAEFPLDKAAVIGCAVATGVGAVVNTAKVAPGSSVLVIGCGAVGLAIVQGAVLAGCDPILASDLVAERARIAGEIGATDLLVGELRDSAAEPLHRTEDGFDWAFEAVGRGPLIAAAFEAVRPGGTVVVVGQAPDGDKVCVNAYELSDREKRIVGCSYGSTRPQIDFPRLIRLYLRGRLPLLDVMVSRLISVEEIGLAFGAMANGSGVRTVVEW